MRRLPISVERNGNFVLVPAETRIVKIDYVQLVAIDEQVMGV
jgi:hypothetical protein